ncbi:uncharacterized protein VP01_3367g1, partial [Puccinia sorghi]
MSVVITPFENCGPVSGQGAPNQIYGYLVVWPFLFLFSSLILISLIQLKLIWKDTLEGLKAHLKGVTFRGAPLISASVVLIHVKRDLEADLAKHGFHGFTFDWNTPSARDCGGCGRCVAGHQKSILRLDSQSRCCSAEGGPSSGGCCINQKAHPVCQNDQEEGKRLQLFVQIHFLSCTPQRKFWHICYETRMRFLISTKSLQTPFPKESRRFGE